jgi:GTP cyclohydrolase IA
MRDSLLYSYWPEMISKASQSAQLHQPEDDDSAGGAVRFSTADWRRFLRSIGEDPSRQGLLETPMRVERAWQDWTAGYRQEPLEILKAFEDGAENYSELIIVRGIPVYSHCEHHLAPFFGTAAVGYLPDKRIVGLSKFTRLVECFARRLQVQERLTWQIADTIMAGLAPRAVGVVLRCRHMCMESRGIKSSNQQTVTSAMLGALETNLAMRTEFLALSRD